jgi:predicted RNA binding protein YcfA (HicA-like mRNA interferase family)
MPRITPVSWKVLECIFKQEGFLLERQKGSHRAYSKSGVLRPVIIPMYREIAVDIIKSNMKSAGMSRDRYFELLEICK